MIAERVPSSFLRSLLDKAADDNATTLVEMALGLPILCLMMFGLIYMCMFGVGLCSTTMGNRACMRYASIHSSTSFTPTTQTTLDNIFNGYDIPYPTHSHTTTVAYSQGNNGQSGNNIGATVTVTNNISYNMSFFGHPLTIMSVGWSAVGTVST